MITYIGDSNMVSLRSTANPAEVAKNLETALNRPLAKDQMPKGLKTEAEEKADTVAAPVIADTIETTEAAKKDDAAKVKTLSEKITSVFSSIKGAVSNFFGAIAAKISQLFNYIVSFTKSSETEEPKEEAVKVSDEFRAKHAGAVILAFKKENNLEKADVLTKEQEQIVDAKLAELEQKEADGQILTRSTFTHAFRPQGAVKD